MRLFRKPAVTLAMIIIFALIMLPVLNFFSKQDAELVSFTSVDDTYYYIDNNIDGLDHTYIDVFYSNLFDTNQLVVNADFNDGIDGWQFSNTSYSDVSNLNATFIANAEFGRVLKIFSVSSVADTYYIVSRFKSDSPMVRLNKTNPFAEASHSGSGEFEIVSLITSQTNGVVDPRVHDRRTSGWTEVEVDYIYVFNISTLITNHQYSPLYKTTFDLMTEEEIKLQMDEFVEKPYLFIDYDSFGYFPNQQRLEKDYYIYQRYLNLESLYKQYNSDLINSDPLKLTPFELGQMIFVDGFLQFIPRKLGSYYRWPVLDNLIGLGVNVVPFLLTSLYEPIADVIPFLPNISSNHIITGVDSGAEYSYDYTDYTLGFSTFWIRVPFKNYMYITNIFKTYTVGSGLSGENKIDRIYYNYVTKVYYGRTSKTKIYVVLQDYELKDIFGLT